MLRTFVASSVIALTAGAAQASVVVAFKGIAGTTVAASVEGTGVTGVDLGRGAGLAQNSGGTFVSRDWEEGTDKASAIANDNWIFWGASLDAGTPYDLTSLTIDYDRSNTGPTSIAIDFFIDGVDQGEIFSNDTVLNSASQTASIDMSAFTDVSGSLFFRLSGWGATGFSGTFDIENDLPGGYGIVLEGDLIVSAVPVPAGLPLLLTALGGAALLGRRRARRS